MGAGTRVNDGPSRHRCRPRRRASSHAARTSIPAARTAAVHLITTSATHPVAPRSLLRQHRREHCRTVRARTQAGPRGGAFYGTLKCRNLRSLRENFRIGCKHPMVWDACPTASCCPARGAAGPVQPRPPAVCRQSWFPARRRRGWPADVPLRQSLWAEPVISGQHGTNTELPRRLPLVRCLWLSGKFRPLAHWLYIRQPGPPIGRPRCAAPFPCVLKPGRGRDPRLHQ